MGSRQLKIGIGGINLDKFLRPQPLTFPMISHFIRRVKDSKGMPLTSVAVYKRGKPMANKKKKKIQINGANRQ